MRKIKRALGYNELRDEYFTPNKKEEEAPIFAVAQRIVKRAELLVGGIANQAFSVFLDSAKDLDTVKKAVEMGYKTEQAEKHHSREEERENKQRARQDREIVLVVERGSALGMKEEDLRSVAAIDIGRANELIRQFEVRQLLLKRARVLSCASYVEQLLSKGGNVDAYLAQAEVIVSQAKQEGVLPAALEEIARGSLERAREIIESAKRAAKHHAFCEQLARRITTAPLPMQEVLIERLDEIRTCDPQSRLVKRLVHDFEELLELPEE